MGRHLRAVMGKSVDAHQRASRRRGKQAEETMSVMTLDELTTTVTKEIHVRASLQATFDAILEQIGPASESPDGRKMPMVLEERPGGRWYRDLGNDEGHYWGTVQAIKRPTLLELCGPLWMSGAVANNVQYRLKEVDGGTLITLRHQALGMMPDGM